ncbi:unnamed protein product [Coffea canephora]|uniref:ABC transporter domain-containing protein n=1 Tax=Coffea canephora TaxID=49390 RepID=A0A068UCS0_COFCA|nr:unnamed protein product [Coffea canephora]
MELPIRTPDSIGRRASYIVETKNLSYKLLSPCNEFSLLCCKNPRKAAKFILKDVNCEARPGEMTAIAGPSGAGKTTLLEILGGEISPRKVSGKVLVNGCSIHPEFFRRICGFVTQDDALFPLLSVEETLMYSALLRLSGGKKEAISRVKVLIKELGLDRVAGRYNKDDSCVRNLNNFGVKRLSCSNSHLEEIFILGERFCKNIFRTKQLFAARIMQALTAGLIIGTIFMNVRNDQRQIALQTRIGFFAFTLTFLLSSTTEGLPIFLQERRIFMRETTRGAYRVSSYVISNTIVFLPFLLMVGLLYTTPVYWLVGLRQNIDGFLYFALVVWMVVLMSNALTACFSALVPNFIMGTSIIAGLMGSFFLFSGYFISKENIPNYWIFMHYISLFKYPFECFMINEYGGKGGRRCLEQSHKWSNLLIMLAFVIGYRVLCFLILWCKCYRSRN